MTPKDNRTREEVERLYAAVSMAVMPLGGTADQTLLLGYRIGLRGLPLEAIERACVMAVDTMKHPPKPVELRRLAGELTSGQSALQAWSKVTAAVAAKGPYKSVSFDDGVSNAVIRNMGGWPSFCARFTDAEAEKWVRLEFLKAYESLPVSADSEACEPLPGIGAASAVGGRQVPPRIHVVRTGLPAHPAAAITGRTKRKALPRPVAVLKNVNDLEEA